MDASELNQCRWLKVALDSLIQHRLNLLSLAENLVPVHDGMPHSTEIKSRVEKLALKILAVDREIENAQINLVQAQVKLTEKIIDGVHNPRTQKIVILRYVECLTFKEISRRSRISLRHVYRLHEKFLENVTLTSA